MKEADGCFLCLSEMASFHSLNLAPESLLVKQTDGDLVKNYSLYWFPLYATAAKGAEENQQPVFCTIRITVIIAEGACACGSIPFTFLL